MYSTNRWQCYLPRLRILAMCAVERVHFFTSCAIIPIKMGTFSGAVRIIDHTLRRTGKSGEDGCEQSHGQTATQHMIGSTPAHTPGPHSQATHAHCTHLRCYLLWLRISAMCLVDRPCAFISCAINFIKMGTFLGASRTIDHTLKVERERGSRRAVSNHMRKPPPSI
jgi:hypothetical protein